MFIINSTLGARIRVLRECKGLTQAQDAEKMNYTVQKYARLEQGLIDISYSVLKNVTPVLGVEVEEITSAMEQTLNREVINAVIDKLKY